MNDPEYEPVLRSDGTEVTELTDADVAKMYHALATAEGRLTHERADELMRKAIHDIE